MKTRIFFILKEFFVVVLTIIAYFLTFYGLEGAGTKGKAFIWIFLPSTIVAFIVMLLLSIIVFSQIKERAKFSQRKDLSKELVLSVRIIKFLIIFSAIAYSYFA